MTQKSGEMQAKVTEIKLAVKNFGDAREAKDDDKADAFFGVVLLGIEALIEQTIKDIPPVTKTEVREVHIPAPNAGQVPPQMAPAKPVDGIRRYVPKFLQGK